MAEVRELAPAARNLQHRADQGPDHPLQKGVRGDPVDEQAVAYLPRGLLHRAHEALVMALRRGKGAEVVLTLDQARRFVEQPEVQMTGDVYGSQPLQRGADGVVEDPVLVASALCIPASVEVLLDGDATPKRQILRQDGRGSVGDRGRVQVRIRPERDDLPGGVHPGVRTAGHDQLDRLPEHRAEGAGERFLDRAKARLGGPTGEVRAIVLHEPGEFSQLYAPTKARGPS